MKRVMITRLEQKQETPMRISMIEPIGGHGGNEFYDFGLCEALGKYCNISFYTCDETHLHETYNLKTKTYKLYQKIYGKSYPLLRAFRYLLGALRTVIHAKKNNSNIGHVHIYHFDGRELITVILCKIFFIKVVATIHDVESFSSSNPSRYASLKFIKFFPFIDRYIVHSRFASLKLNGISRGLIKKRLHIVAHGDTDFIYKGDLTKIDARKSIVIPADKKIILFFGQIKKVKGLDILLSAFSGLAKADPAYHLLIIGRPWKVDGQLIKDQISKLGIDAQVTINMAYVTNEDVPKYFVAADIVVLPYLKIYSSGVLLRALDYKTPVVVSDLPPLVDIIHDGENGRVFRCGNSDHLKSVITEMMQAPQLLKTYAEAGKKTVQDKYSWDVVARETIAVYRAV